MEEHSSGYLEALVNSMPRRVKALLDNDGGHTKYWQLTWCMLILTTFPKWCTHFCWQGFRFYWLYFELFWGENKLTLLYNLHTDYFSLCQSVISSVFSHEEYTPHISVDILKYLQRCEGCAHFCDTLYIYIYIYTDWIFKTKKFYFVGLALKTSFVIASYFIQIQTRV